MQNQEKCAVRMHNHGRSDSLNSAGLPSSDILNMDETGCLWKALPDIGFGKKGKMCEGGK